MAKKVESPRSCIIFGETDSRMRDNYRIGCCLLGKISINLYGTKDSTMFRTIFVGLPDRKGKLFQKIPPMFVPF